MKKKPKIGITMGDPAGIGPEISISAALDLEIRKRADIFILGNLSVLQQTAVRMKKRIIFDIITENDEISNKNGHVPLLVTDTLSGIIKPGKWSRETGLASFLAVKKAAELCLKNKIDAMVTAPISKAAWQSANMFYVGHTELLAKITKNKRYSMMFFGGAFRLILATIHEPMKKVPAMITKELVIQKGITGVQMLRKYMSIKKPRLAIAGLNPHAGEEGLLGKEEIKEIRPAVEYLRKKGINVSGPWPPDTLFAEAVKGKYDLILCMYHDQGLIPFKMLALHQGVNVTAGLPIIRTSPDHGTAFDLAGKNKANPGSMKAAVLLAAEMAAHSRRKKN